jgi:Fe-S oxidoreductase
MQAALGYEGAQQALGEPALAILEDPRLMGCIQCGACGGACPFGYLMAFPPIRMLAAARSETFQRVLASDDIWMCVACSACTAACPAQLPLTANLMARAKEELVLAGKVPSELQAALENSQRYGNPLGESPRKRTDWMRGIESLVPVMGKDKRQAEVLWFVGDYASYHPRVQPASRTLALVLNRLKVDFAILGQEENSDGDSQRLAGERGLFELLAEKNARALRKYRFERIITTDPHAYNAFKNEYPQLGIAYPVQHYTEFLAERLDSIRPLLTREVKKTVTYHDPCYLGRVNGIYDAPRKLLQAIPGLKLVEMPHNRKNSLCCGGGGGGMWMDGFQWEKAHVRLSEWRVQEALLVGAELLAVSCPYEAPRFEDATKTVKQAEGLLVRDVIELFSDAMESPV